MNSDKNSKKSKSNNSNKNSQDSNRCDMKIKSHIDMRIQYHTA